MSLYGMMRTGVSGMAAQSTRLATVADNIANSGTNGYKRASVEFSSLVIPNAGTSYVSGGVATTVRYAISQAGNTQYTTSGTDLSIKGNGFFVVQNSNGQPFLTRAGSFVPDGEGRLINAAGFYLMGYSYENGIPSPVANGYAGLTEVRIPTNELQATPTTLATYAANLPYNAPVIPAGSLPSSNDPGAEFTAKRSLVVYDNVGQEVLLDIFFTRTGAGASGTISAGPNVSGYSEANTPVPAAGSHAFPFTGLAGLGWTDGDSVSFTMNIDGADVDVTGTLTGGAWSFAADDPATLPAGVTLAFDVSASDLEVTVVNASGVQVTASAGNFTSTPASAPDVSGYSAAGTTVPGNGHEFTFPDLADLAWEDGDTVSFTMAIDGANVRVTGTFGGGAWSFTPDDPAALPAGITLGFDTSTPDLKVTVNNTTGTAVTASASGFTSTRIVPATTDTWEMSVFYQPDAAATTSFPYNQPAIQTATLTFDGYGKLVGPDTINLDLTALNGELIEMNISGMTQLAADFTQGEVSRNGAGPSAIDGVLIGTDGILYARDAKGNTTPLYRLPVASVQSPDQLQVLPGNVFSVGLDSGDVQIGFPGSGGLGDIISGSVENSNVDIAEELTSMIESQRNYTANSKVFQTGSDLMDVLVNLKR